MSAAPTSSAAKPTIANADLLALQAYVTAADSAQYSSLAADTVVLDLTHSNLRQRHAEVRFDLHDTISTLRARIHQKTGTPPQFQHLQFLRGTTPESGVLADVPPGTDDDKMLGYYSPHNGATVHCTDTDPNSGSRGGRYEDTSLVEKYRMTDEEYDKRRGTLRDWGRQKKQADPNFNLAKHAREHRELMEVTRQAKLGYPLPAGYEFDGSGKVVRVEVADEKENVGNSGGAADSASASAAAAKAEEEHGPQSVEGMAAGMRCEVQPGGRRGTVSYVGEIPELGSGGGRWVGVTFDEPVGKTDGTVKNGKRYFDAGAPNRGGFVRGKNVSVGDFPERDIMDELDSDSEDEL